MGGTIAIIARIPRTANGNLNRDMAAVARALEKLAGTSERHGLEALAHEARVISGSFSTRIQALTVPELRITDGHHPQNPRMK